MTARILNASMAAIVSMVPVIALMVITANIANFMIHVTTLFA
jgi:hypothetical protein